MGEPGWWMNVCTSAAENYVIKIDNCTPDLAQASPSPKNDEISDTES